MADAANTSGAIPRHIGVILDGNRRWARQQGIPTLEGHRKGYDGLKDVAKHTFSRGVEYLSAFIFSTENWKRSEEEVGYLMDLALRMATRDLKELHKDNIRVLWAGRRQGLSKKVIKAIDNAVIETANNTGGTLVLCFNYGGQPEIADAVKRIIDSGVAADEVDEALIAKNMYTPEVPECDLIIRTSGEQRISGFQLWRASYAEFLFVDKHWPDFKAADMDNALDDFAERERRNGK